jgi:hypothetical protein
VQRARDDVADEEVHQRGLPAAAANQDARVPGRPDEEANDLSPVGPAPAAAARLGRVVARLPEVLVREPVEVEARKGHDHIEEAVLEGDEEPRGAVECHFALVVRGPDRAEEVGADGQEGDVLDVGVAVRQGGQRAVTDTASSGRTGTGDS